ncbi:glycoside hydrolase superfamily [Zychaea mexicana]|uniref:glycoside hydrolase superfamily n=1 Tax=Zychaea mexicana TaxID=64656 RepID=UPI0022FDF762|nr:glycoside hydrolase superfamily [Zychaea mexicana]KAI9493806.1 glycoside hydrolase superfamily [Zychaea mexicana]
MNAIRGQNSASEGNTEPNEWQKPLDYYCRDDTEDVLVISFLYQFGSNPPAIDLSDSSDACLGKFPGTELLDCPQMEPAIKACQSKDKIVLLSLGGATGTYGLSSESEGHELADTLWNTFGGGNGDVRPFGNASVDGFDLDIEAGDIAGYTAFVERMREHYDSDTSKKYYISSAPQCPYPDHYMSDALNSAWFDFVWVQFYNNECGVTTDKFNYDRWDEWARKEAINKDVKLFIGVPAASYAAGRGYVPYQDLTEAITQVRSKYDSFGGVMMWDASAAYANDDVSPSYGQAVAKFLHGNNSNSTTGGGNSTLSFFPSSSLPSTDLSPTPSSSPLTNGSATTTTTATESSVSLPPSAGSTSTRYINYVNITNLQQLRLIRCRFFYFS